MARGTSSKESANELQLDKGDGKVKESHSSQPILQESQEWN
jgi:hypothetical protein